MAQPRSQQICLEATSYYHCICRCVRRAFLCGYDKETGRSFEHRRGLLEARMFKLSEAFCIDIAAYSIMQNHYHIGLHVNQAKALALSDKEVCQHWHRLFKGNQFSRSFVKGEKLSYAENMALSIFVKVWRKRLYSISWFMKCLNEPIAKMANKEDGCKGHFWEARFISKAILDETALIASMAYIDLNPIRAAIAESPEESEYTSIQKRIKASMTKTLAQPNTLMPFVGSLKERMSEGLPFEFEDYLKLLDYTARSNREGQAVDPSKTTSRIFQCLSIKPGGWHTASNQFDALFSQCVGNRESIKRICQMTNRQWVKNQRNCEAVFSK